MRQALSAPECFLSDRISNVSSVTLGHSCPPFTPDQVLSDRLTQQGLSACCCVKHLSLIKKGFEQLLRVVFAARTRSRGGERWQGVKILSHKIKLTGGAATSFQKNTEVKVEVQLDFLTFGIAAR